MSTRVGYTGGDTDAPTYGSVCGGDGHTEAMKVEYDPAVISYEDLLKVFKLFDDDKTGTVSFKNLKRVCQELGENMTDDELKEMMDWADKDGDGVLNEDEFINAVMRKKD